jgi:hypothetical protein
LGSEQADRINLDAQQLVRINSNVNKLDLPGYIIQPAEHHDFDAEYCLSSQIIWPKIQVKSGFGGCRGIKKIAIMRFYVG